MSDQTSHDAMRQIDRVQAQLDEISDAVAAEVAAGLIAHEIRNLLTPAVAYTQMALREPDQPAETRRVLEHSVCAMRRACEVAELILATYRSPPPQDAEPHCHIATLVNDCLASLAWDAQTPVCLDVRVPPHLAAVIPIESLRHVVLNLLLNAKAALPTDGGKISVSASLVDGSTWKRRVAIAITDDGKGISPPLLAQLQTSLAAGSPARASNQGLGLLLCHRLLKASGGVLTIDSQQGSGTTVTVSLPLANMTRLASAA